MEFSKKNLGTYFFFFYRQIYVLRIFEHYFRPGDDSVFKHSFVCTDFFKIWTSNEKLKIETFGYNFR